MKGKVALVTGAAKGIGAAAADALLRAGAQVARVDIEAPGDAIIQANVADSGACEAAVAATIARFGRLDVLVNSAGIQRYGDVLDAPEEQWDEVLGVNLKGAFLMTKHAMPHLIASGAGAVVNVASVQAFAAQRGVVAYAASKGGLVAFTKALAIDHAPVVRANCVCPGSVDTPMLRGAAELFATGNTDDTVKSWGAMHPMGRVARAEEVADAIVFLAGPSSSFITGAALMVDGGLLSMIGGT